MRKFKLNPHVSNCGSRKGILRDHNATYSESIFNAGHADELVSGGFLIEVFDGVEPLQKEVIEVAENKTIVEETEVLETPTNETIEPEKEDFEEIDLSEMANAKKKVKGKKGK